MLEKVRDPDLKVLVVWEPILPTDWEQPTTSVLSRIHHPGIVQFWDHDHLIAHAISHEMASDPARPKPRCCTLRGNLWDFAALYPKGTLWQNDPPKPAFADGTVASVQSDLAGEFAVLQNQKN